MIEEKFDQLVGRLNAVELILAQVLTFAILPVKDKKELIQGLIEELERRKHRLTENQYRYAEECFDRITDNALRSAIMLMEEAKKQFGQ